MKSKYAIGSGILVLLISSLVWVSPNPDQRLEPSGQNSSFNYAGNSFPEYITNTRKMIASARQDLSGPDREQIITGNAPFERMPDPDCSIQDRQIPQRGILLLHGLTDSPYSVHTLGDYFARKCFRVMSILLPGHGTRVGDLLDVTWQAWAKAVTFGLESLAKEVDHLYMLGFSTGGTLSVYQAMTDKRIKGLFLFSPAIAIKPTARFSCWLDQLGAFRSEFRWLDVQPDENYYKYESFPANAACQVFKLTKKIDDTRNSQPINLPVFIATSEDDTTVDAQATITWFAKVNNANKRMLLYSTNNPVVPDGTLVINNAFPDSRIVSSSHMGITLPADDPHYGEAGKYAFCSHYYQGKDKQNTEFKNCKDGTNIFLGEPTKSNKKLGIIRRLTYNPNYDALLIELGKFLDGLP